MIVVELHDRANTLVKVLSGTRHAAYRPVLNSDGSGSFEIHRADPDVAKLNILQGGINGYIVHLLRRSPLALPGDDFVDRFSFQVEAVGFGLDQGEEQSAWITVAGRGTLSLLEDRICFPPGFDGVNPATVTSQWQIYAGVAGGAIMDAEIDRSASRFAVPITHTVQTSSVLQTVKLRFNNLRLLHDYLVQAGPMDAQMYGLDYRCVDHRGTDKSAQVAVQLGPQDSLLGLQLAADASAVKNWIIAQGTGEGINSKLAVVSDAPSIAALRRREGFLDARQVDDQTQLGLTAAGSLAQFKAVDQRITTKFTDSAHAQLYRDFDLGDVITLAAAPLGLSQKVRLVAYTVADTDAEVEDVSLDLNSMRAEYLIKLLQGTVLPAVGSLSVLNRMPQGSTFNDSAYFAESADATHPFRFRRFVPTNVLKLTAVKLSFFREAFRRPVAATNNAAVSSAAGSAHGHSISGQVTGAVHTHTVQVDGDGTGTLPLSLHTGPVAWKTNNTTLTYFPTTLAASGGETVTGATSTNENAHTHQVTSNVTLTDGIFEGATANNVKVIINGTDRTVALGGPAGGFASDQSELDITQWITLGAWNLIELQPDGLGRIAGDYRATGWVQAA